MKYLIKGDGTDECVNFLKSIFEEFYGSGRYNYEGKHYYYVNDTNEVHTVSIDSCTIKNLEEQGYIIVQDYKTIMNSIYDLFFYL
jgi:hypothetical protein